MSRLQVTAANELSIETSTGQRFAIHPLWLRERCRDARTYDLHSGQRLEDPSDWDPALTVTAVTEIEPGRFRVSFSDGHAAEFLGSDILAEARRSAGDHDCPVPQLWDATLGEPARAAWTATPADAQKAAWLQSFLELGFIVFRDVPVEPGMVLKVAASFGYTRDTNFGLMFDVRSVPDANDLAYTAMALDPHTDNPYRSPVPGVQLLHCLVNGTQGGLSTLVDGYAAVQALKDSDPEGFRILAQTPIRFRFRDAATEFVASTPLIEVDGAGRVQAICFSPRLDYVPLKPPHELQLFFRARRAFDKLLRSARFGIRFLLNPGDLLMMDNRRLLHGRTGFDPREGLRHLQGCYIDIDSPRSQYRVLRRRLATAGSST